MTLSSAVVSRVREFAHVYPLPLDDTLHAWMQRLCEQIRHDFACPEPHDADEIVFEWGTCSPGYLGMLVLQYRDTTGQQTGLVGWQLLQPTDAGTRTLCDTPVHYDLQTGHYFSQISWWFAPVAAIDHLAASGLQVFSSSPSSSPSPSETTYVTA